MDLGDFIKKKRALEAQTNITVTHYTFSRPNRALTLPGPNGRRVKRTPGMAADLIRRVWPIGKILAYP